MEGIKEEREIERKRKRGRELERKIGREIEREREQYRRKIGDGGERIFSREQDLC